MLTALDRRRDYVVYHVIHYLMIACSVILLPTRRILKFSEESFAGKLRPLKFTFISVFFETLGRKFFEQFLKTRRIQQQLPTKVELNFVIISLTVF